MPQQQMLIANFALLTVQLSPSAVSGSAEPLGIEPRDEMLAEDSPNGSTEFTEVCSPKFDN